MVYLQGVVGAIVMALGGITSIVTLLYLVYRAFKVTWYWGFITLLVPFGFVPFSVLHWKSAKAPLLLFLISLGTAIAAFALRTYLSMNYPTPV